MEDDIDIEEHDVLEHPKIKTIFPDLTRIKIEVPDDDYDDQTMDIQDKGPGSTADPDEEYTCYRNKIIIGSKPSTSLKTTGENSNGESLTFGRRPIKQEVEEFDENNDQDMTGNDDFQNVEHLSEDFENDGHLNVNEEHLNEEHSSVLILGSKPCSDNVTTHLNNSHNRTVSESSESDLDIKESTVALTDWGPILERSSCYCEECKILFPTTNTLNAHKMAVHSFLIAVETNKAVKSTAKNKSKEMSTEKFCNHCNKMFPDSNSLISHLYETLTTDKNKGQKEVKPQKVLVTTPVKIPVKTPVKTPVKPEMEENEEDGLLLQCDVCYRYFKKKTSYYCHMLDVHSRNVTKYNFKPFNPRCVYCKTYTSYSRSYNVHISRCRLRPSASEAKTDLKTVVKAETAPKLPSQKVTQYHCRICNSIFHKYDQARHHRVAKHPHLKNISIFKSVTVSRPTPSLTVKKSALISRPMPKSQKDLLISKIKSPEKKTAGPNVICVPKSILFKCAECHLHFTSCTAAYVHPKTCSKGTTNKNVYKCKLCALNFDIEDRSLHSLQHKYSERFTIHPYDENMYGKVLNRCPDCSTYLYEKNFTNHINNCKGGGVKCKICNLNIHISCVDDHQKRHLMLGPMKKELILVNFEKIVDESNLKQELKEPVKRKATESISETTPKKAKPDNIIYYCGKCDSYTHTLRYKKLHTSGECKDLKFKGKGICNVCGLLISLDRHTHLHAENPKLKLSEMLFYTIEDNKMINPPIPKYPRCHKCKVHFCKRKAVQAHSCSDAQKTCKYCKLKFSDMAFKLHVKFHEYGRKPAKIQTPSSTPVKQPATYTGLPELLKKYEMLTNTWNILYLCATCDITCDNYDTAVEHSQKHFNNMENYDVIVKNCDICDLKFDSVCFEKHKDLHAYNNTINANSFKVLKYDHSKLFKSGWTEVFNTLDGTQAEQIEARSIYAHTKSVKMRIIKDGAPETTLYCCRQCDMYIHPRAVASHYAQSCETGSALPCEVCGILFNTIKGKSEHEVHHETTDEFRVVYFNEQGDNSFNQTLRDQNKRVANRFHFHVCTSCKSCIKYRIAKHRCAEKPNLVLCTKCHLYFNKKAYKKHVNHHIRFPRLGKKHIKVTPFSPNGDNIDQNSSDAEKVKVKLYKCECGLHFTTSPAAERHLRTCKSGVEITKEHCSKCERLFDTTQLVTHLCTHHSNDKNTVFEIIDISDGREVRKENNLLYKRLTSSPTKAQSSNKTGPNKLQPSTTNSKIQSQKSKKNPSLFKCYDCDVYYLTKGGLQYHFQCNHQVGKVQRCGYCKLNFMPLTLVKHIHFHHKTIKCKASDFRIHVVKPTETPPVKPTTITQKRAEDKKQYTHKALATKNTVTAKIKSKKIGTQYRCSKKLLRSLNLSLFSDKIYKCEICEMCVLKKRYVYIHKALCSTVNTIKCDDCGNLFTIYSIDKHKYVHHVKMGLTKADLKIELFNPDKLEEIEDSIDSAVESSKDSPSLQKREKVSNKDKEAISLKHDEDVSEDEHTNSDSRTYKLEHVLFKCECGCHFLTDAGLESHTTRVHHRNEPFSSEKCGICDLEFTPKNLAKHMELHIANANLTRENFMVLPSSVHNNQILHKFMFTCRKCRTSFHTLRSLELHIEDTLTCALNVNGLQKCDSCGFQFKVVSKKHEATHAILKEIGEEYLVIESIGNKLRILDTNTSEDIDETNTDVDMKESINNTENDSIAMEVDEESNVSLESQNSSLKTRKRIKSLIDSKLYDNTIYKCGTCSIHFISCDTSLTHRRKRQCSQQSTKTCPICSLEFHTGKLQMHIYVHHEKMNLSKKDLTVIVHSNDDNYLYQCERCNVNCMTQYALEQHSCSSAVVKCNICNYKFKQKGLERHMSIHHTQNKLKREDLCIFNENGDIIAGNDSSRIVDESDSVDNITDANEGNAIEMEEPEELKNEISTLNSDLYTSKLFRCSECCIHFLTKKTLEWHTSHSKHNVQKSKCTFCDFDFAITHLPTHVFVHHDKLNLSAEHFCITSNEDCASISESMESLDDSSVTSFVDVNSIANSPKTVRKYVNKKTKLNIKIVATSSKIETESSIVNNTKPNIETNSDSAVSNPGTSKPETSKLNPDQKTIKTKKNLQNIELDLDPDTIDVNSQDASDPIASSPSRTSEPAIETANTSSSFEDKTNGDNSLIKLYKCSECNVCFLTQRICYKHVIKHEPIDPKNYIECKLCGYQFMIINSLHNHIAKHHTEKFKPENVLIEEYHPNVLCHGSPKIDIYYGSDRLQSKLISTTSDGSADLLDVNNSTDDVNNSTDDMNNSTDDVVMNIDTSFEDNELNRSDDKDVYLLGK